MTLDEINALGQIIDTTWGRSSGYAAEADSCKIALVGDCLRVTYSMICTFASGNPMSEQARSYEKDADQIITKLVSNVKADFKEATGNSLKLKIYRPPDSSFEIIGVQSHVSPKRTALYRRQFLYALS